MSQQYINYGNTANDGTGDPLRDAFIKVDDNFSQIWAAGPVGSNITVLNNTVGVTNTNGNLILSPNGVGIIQTNRHVYPRLDNTYDLGANTLRYRSLFVGDGGINISGNLTLGNISDLKIPGGNNGYVIQTDGAGNLSWAAQSGSGNGNPGGANTQVQFNDGGLFAGNATFTFSKVTGNLNVPTITVGNRIVSDVGRFEHYLFANAFQVGLGNANTWDISGNVLSAPTGASWISNVVTGDEYISSAVNGYLNLETYDVAANLASQIHLEHGLVQINIVDGANLTWQFNQDGSFDVPGNIIANGNITANYFFGNGSQLTGLPGGVIQGNIPPENPNDTTLWWDDITGRLYVWYTDIDGSQWVDAAPAGPPSTYGNANVVAYAQDGWAGNIIPSGNAVYTLGNATNQWSDLYVSNATIYMNNVPISLGAGNVLTVNGEAVLSNDSNTEIATTGNITANYFIGDGSLLTGIPGGSTGNVGFVGDVIYDLNGIILENADLSHGATAALILPLNGDSTNPIQINNTYGNILLQTGVGSDITADWTFDNTGVLTIPGEIAAVNTSQVGSALGIATNADGGNVGYISGGTATAMSVAYNPAIISTYAVGSTITFQDNTVGTVTQIDDYGPTSIDIFYLPEKSGVLFPITLQTSNYAAASSANATIAVGSNGVPGINTWTFGNTGVLTVPGNTVTSSLYTDNSGYRLNLEGNNNSVTTAKLQLDNDNGHIRLIVGNVATPATWAFRDNGTLTTPGSIVTPPVPLANLTAVAGARAFVSDGNLVAAGNFGAQIGNAGSNVVPVYSDGANWYIG